ncbi:putative reverse transcriptase, RNA-dependent DNA polymerase [Tanacetum coccineum]
MIYLKNMVGYKMGYFKGKSYDKIRPMFKEEYNKIQTLFKKDTEVEKTKTKRVAEETLLQESFKKLRTAEASSSEPIQEQPIEEPKELSEEELKKMVRNITEAYQVFEDMLKGFDREDLVTLWSLVKERFRSAEPTEDMERALWVELKRLFEPDNKMANPEARTTTNVDGNSTSTIPGHVTTEEKTQKKNHVKDRRYDKSKVECFNYHKMGHFARECRGSRNRSRVENQDKPQEDYELWTIFLLKQWCLLMEQIQSLDKLIGSQISDNNRKGVGYNTVPPPPIGLFSPPTIDLSNPGLNEFQQPEFEGYGLKENKDVCENSSNEIKKTTDAPIIKDWVSDCDEDEFEVAHIVDGQTIAITEASVRRHLQLANADGITFLPNTETFEQLTLMGYVYNDDKLTFQKGGDHTGSDERQQDKDDVYGNYKIYAMIFDIATVDEFDVGRGYTSRKKNNEMKQDLVMKIFHRRQTSRDPWLSLVYLHPSLDSPEWEVSGPP